MNLLKYFSISFLVFVSLLLGSSAYATTMTTDDNGKVIVLADVNIYDAKITSQNGNQINISFNLDNGQGVQSGIKYSVSLIKENGGSQVEMDEFIYPEVLSLSSNSSIKKEISYIAPSNISGDYTLMVKAKSPSGLPLGLGIAGKVKLTSTVTGIMINTDTCNLTVVGEKGSPKYNLVQGVDIAANENLVLTCSAINSSKADISASPSYETFLRSVYGEQVLQDGGDIASISFKAGEKKNFSLTLPKAQKPQSYDIKVALKTGDVISNFVTAHYVLRGLSATIQNFSLDKDSYNKDDVANMSFMWSTSAENFPNSRLGETTVHPAITMTVSVLDDKNKECITPINQVIAEGAKDGKVDLTAPITANCQNPQATITLKDPSGNILDQKFVSFETKTDKQDNAKSPGSSKTILIVFGILVVLGLAGYFISLKNKENETINQ